MNTIKVTTTNETILVPSFTVDAINIHPSVLRGLIPVFTPAFLSAEGSEVRCETVEIESEISIEEVETRILQIVSIGIKEVLLNSWEYLYFIKIRKNGNGIIITVRGA